MYILDIHAVTVYLAKEVWCIVKSWMAKRSRAYKLKIKHQHKGTV